MEEKKKERIGVIVVGIALFIFSQVNGILNSTATVSNRSVFEHLVLKSTVYTGIGLILSFSGLYFLGKLPKSDITKFGKIAGYVGIVFGFLCLVNVVMYYQSI